MAALLARLVMALAMTAVGVLHFVRPGPFVRIVPPFLPSPLTLVYVSGVCEIAGGLGLLVPPVARAAAWGLVALYVAVFPANIYQLMYRVSFADGVAPPPLWGLWLRLPIQGVLIYWAYRLAQSP